MYVSDTSIFPHSGLRVRITNMNGQDFITELKSDMKIDELKIISLSHFSSPAESMKKSLYHRILMVRTGKVLSEERTVFEEEIQNNGMFKLKPSLGVGNTLGQYNFDDTNEL